MPLLDPGIDPDSITPAEFRDLIAKASDRDLAELSRDPELRARVLTEIFDQMPLRLRPEKTRGVDAVVHWRIGGDRPDVWEVVIRDERCTVATPPQDAAPTLTLELGDVAFLRMIAGQANGMKLMLTRKLKLRGDMMLAPRLEGMFRTDPSAVER